MRQQDCIIGLGTITEDITALANTSLRLDREQELQQSLFERLPVMLTMYDPATKVFHFNRAFSETFEWTADEAAEVDLMEKFYPDPDLRAEVAAYMQKAENGWREFAVTAKDGAVVPSLWSNIRLSDDTMVGVGIDLRELRRAQEAREEILMRISDAFFAVDRQWRFVDVNPAAAAGFRKTREQLLGNNLWDVFPEAIVTPFEDHYRQAMETKVPQRFEIFYSPFQIWVTVQVYPSDDGLAIFFQDVTEQHHLRHELEEQMALLDSLFESAPIGLGFWDVDLRFTRINRTLADINGLPPEAHMGKRPSELLPYLEGIAEIEELWRGILKSGTPVMDMEVSGNTQASDQPRVWREHFYPVRRQGQIIGIGAVVEDVTDLKAVEAEREHLVQGLAEERTRLVQMTENLEVLVGERTEQIRLLAGQLTVAEQEERERISQVLHDSIQQLLYSIQFRLQLLTSDLSAQFASSAQESLAELGRITADAINVTRHISRDLSIPGLETGDVENLLKLLAQHSQEMHGLRTTISVQGSPSISAKNTWILLYHVLRELLFNVVKHAGVMTVDISAFVQDDWLEISVHDNGQGFDMETLVTESAGQMGGLSTLQRRVQMFQGKVNVQTAPGRGTVVTIRLPL